MLNALPKRPSQTIGWTSEMISCIGFLYHLIRSLLVRAHSPWSGLLFRLGAALKAFSRALSCCATCPCVVTADLVRSSAVVLYLLALIIVILCLNASILLDSSSLMLRPVSSR